MVWKTNNQGFKEATFIQTGGRGEEVGQREVAGVVAEVEQMVQHVIDKKMGGVPWEQAIPAPVQTAHPGSQHWEDKPPLPLAVKTSRGWGSRRNCQIFTT